MLPKISAAKGWSLMGDEDLAEKARQSLRDARFLHAKGVASDTSRWGAEEAAWEIKRAELPLLHLLCLSYGVEVGYLMKGNAAVLRPLTQRAPSSAGSDEQPLGAEKLSRQSLYSRCKNKLVPLCRQEVEQMA